LEELENALFILFIAELDPLCSNLFDELFVLILLELLLEMLLFFKNSLEYKLELVDEIIPEEGILGFTLNK
jgi:hypothetical protein